ncbi:homeobox-leucine zipper protein HAT14-like [Curcuma longa]|uniref:homeobox-leucine zipper protein HAT14-like n=1 Tax=Curcuma longa TaxID=136217 RepID=UPI003D9EA770
MQADECDTNLALSIGGGEFKSNNDHGDGEKPSDCLALFPSQEGEEADGRAARKRPQSVSRSEDSEATETGGVKEASGKKKLRLSKEQLALLEHNFTEHNVLNSKRKQELASRLNIQPRQVEVWFQNRRARTKLKQTEGDCKSLKKWCEKLREENQKLREEIEELRSRNSTHESPIHMQMPTLNMCQSCRRRRAAEFIGGGGGGGGGGRSSKDGFCAKKEQNNWSLYVTGQ